MKRLSGFLWLGCFFIFLNANAADDLLSLFREARDRAFQFRAELARLDASKEGAKAARALFFPSLNLEAGYSSTDSQASADGLELLN
jgi:outer membrane protein TolC